MTSLDAAVEIVALNVFGIADRCGEVITRALVQGDKRDRSTVAPHCP